MPSEYSVFFCGCLLASTVYSTNLTSACWGNCIRKCCQNHQKMINRSCVESSGEDLFHPLSMSVHKNDENLTSTNISDSHFNIVFGDPCEGRGKYSLNPDKYPDDKHYLLENGYLYLPLIPANMSTSQYCLEAVGDFSSSLLTFVCFPPNSVPNTTKFTWYPVGMITSLPFLLITVVVYVSLRELRTLHGKCLICYASMLFIGYLFLAVVQMKIFSDNKWCVFFAFVIQFSFLASFFWINLMCFDIWWVFSKVRPLRGSMEEDESKKFVIYCVYAWGCTFIISTITAVMDSLETIPDTFIKPKIGRGKCWFQEDATAVLYYYLPMGVLLLLNTFMFVATACRLKAHSNETKVLKREGSKRHYECDRYRFKLYLKLCTVMGMNWIMELATFLLENSHPSYWYLWFAADIYNTLQGVPIFLIFICNRRILRLLNHRLCSGLQLVSSTSTTTTSKFNSSTKSGN